MAAWLHAIARSDHLKTVMERNIAEFASGVMALERVQPRRRRLEDGVFDGIFELTIKGPDGVNRRICLRGVADPRRSARGYVISPGVPFGEDSWRCTVPELRLVLQTPPVDTALPALAILTDPSRARALLEDGIRRCSPAHADISIAGCTPTVTRYNPGSRCTVVYRLEYGAEPEGKDWPRWSSQKPIGATRVGSPTWVCVRSGSPSFAGAPPSPSPSRWRSSRS